MISTHSNPFSNTSSNQHHHDLNESGILSEQINNKTPPDSAVEANRQDDDDYIVLLDDSDEENSTVQPSSCRTADGPGDRTVDSPTLIKHETNREPPEQAPELHEADDDDADADEDDAALYEIIDGIMFHTFQTNEELRQFTIEDEKGRQKKETKYGGRKSTGKGTASYSTGRRKSSIGPGKQHQQSDQQQQSDSAFVSPELDDYLSKKFGNKNRSRLTGLDDENEISLSESFDSSFSRKSKGKSKKSTPEIVPVNEAITELDDDERIDNDAAYRRCLKSVERAYSSYHEKMRGKFRPQPLDDQRVREALGALHQNFVSSSTPPSIYSSSPFDCSAREAKRPTVEYDELGSPPPAFVQELDLDRARSNRLENIPKSDNDIHFKLEPQEENNLTEIKLKMEDDEQLNQLNKLNQTATDKQQPKKKNRHEEEGYDITRIISKHSKRDIRLPARFHESGILVGSQWILPHFEEDKSRSSRKQSTGKKRIGRPPKSDLANNNHSFVEAPTSATPETAPVNQPESDPLNPDNLMSDDEDSTPGNDLSTASNLASNKLSTSIVNSPISANDHDKSSKKRNLLKFLWRELFYANNAMRRQYYQDRAILPRVNKFEVVSEGCRTIENLKKQVKNRSYCENSLITWQNKLKLTLASIEKSNGQLNAEELNEIEKTLNSYRNNMRKVDQLLSQADDLRHEIDSNSKLAYNSDTFLNPPPATVSHNSVSNSNHQNGSMNRMLINNPPPNYSNSNHTAPNVPFIHNSRVFNLKPEKPSVSPKVNGLISGTILGRKPRMGKTHLTNGSNSNQMKINANNFNSNFLPQPGTSTSGSSYLTFKLTANGLQTNQSNMASSIASSPNHQPVRNYAKILPKSNPNLVKLSAPIPFLQNHYLIPTTHNLVISPINHPINNISSTITTSCQPGQTLSTVNYGPRSSVMPSLISKPNCDSQQSLLLKPSAKSSTFK